jgi:hypothetical protein
VAPTSALGSSIHHLDAARSYSQWTGFCSRFTTNIGDDTHAENSRTETRNRAEAAMTSRDKLAEAYEAWKRASDQHNDMMRNVMEGKPLDGEAMKQKLGEIELLHAAWMELAQAPARK